MIDESRETNCSEQNSVPMIDENEKRDREIYCMNSQHRGNEQIGLKFSPDIWRRWKRTFGNGLHD